jgi:hypothetical protein
MSTCTTFSFGDDLLDVAPDALQMRSLVGETMSIGVVTFLERKGTKDAAPAVYHPLEDETVSKPFARCSVADCT